MIETTRIEITLVTQYACVKSAMPMTRVFIPLKMFYEIKEEFYERHHDVAGSVTHLRPV